MWGERLEEIDGRHLAQVPDHRRHGHVLQEGSPHLRGGGKEEEREGGR